MNFMDTLFNLSAHMPTTMGLLFSALSCLIVGALLPLLSLKKPRLAQQLGMISAVTGSVIGCTTSLSVLISTTTFDFAIPWETAGVTLSFNLDPLAAFFMLPLFLLVGGGAIYGSGYLDPLSKDGNSGFHWFFYNLLALSMIVVVIAANGLIFLLAWEMMSISSFFLVTYSFRNPDTLKAGRLYLIATHVGGALLFVFFLEAGRICGTLDFAGFTTLSGISTPRSIFFFLLILIGFGAKAGLFPLHVWLPDAHPAAPSHVSALMSGVMIKTAIYGLLRMLTFLPPLPAWCSILVITLGIGGAIFGIAMAMLQKDLKRTLAFSTVENIGLIFLGIGLWLYGTSTGHPVAAALALAGGMLHIWNHALFKGILFFGAGAIQHATGTRTISHLGGLLRRMPIASSLIILASCAISALPPLNGFISEWLLLMSILSLGQTTIGAYALFFLLLTALLALVGGLVAVTFSRLIGLIQLGEPRQPRTARAEEPVFSILAPMLLLGLLCLGIGLLPGVALKLLSGAARILTGGGTSLPLPGLPFGPLWSISGSFLLLFFIALLTKISPRNSRTRKPVSTWGCAFSKPNPRMSYTAGGYSQLAADSLLCTAMLPTNTGNPVVQGIFATATKFRQISRDPILQRGLVPIFRQTAQWAYLFRKLQAGKLNIYLLYMFLTTTLLLGWVMWLG